MSTAARRIEIYDTTLRDGTQGEGFNLSLQDKLLIAQKLDDLGVDYIEGGFPLSNPQDAGAAVLCLCDTNGGSLPEFVEEVVERVKRETSGAIGIHTHNDGGLAVANALSGIRAGASHAQGTINGVGERCGNMDLTTLI